MYVLTEKSTGGVYAIENKDGINSVHVFELEDDAIRYHELLKAEDYSKDLEILEVDPKVVALNCNNYGYAFSIIGPDELIIPPNDYF
jgi:hypothetical protein